MAHKQILAEGKYLRLIAEGHWEYAERHRSSGAVVVIGVTPEDELLLVEQYRIPLGRRVLELPAGLVGDDQGHEQEDLATAARRELVEETGYEAATVELLTAGPSSAGLTSEVISIYLATGLKKLSDGGGVVGEDITVHRLPLNGIHARLMKMQAGGLMVDYKIFVGLHFLSARQR